MPFINLKTNVKVQEETCEAVKSAFGEAITTIPGKSESWLMVGIDDEKKLYFKGSPEAAAMIEVSIFGNASNKDFELLTGRITDIVSDNLSIPSDRIYVKYECIDHWGWNGSNF